MTNPHLAKHAVNIEKQETYTETDILKIERIYNDLVNKYQIALADAICRPQGVIPDSAKNLISSELITMAAVRHRNQLKMVS